MITFSPSEMETLGLVYLAGLALLFLIFVWILAGVKHKIKLALLGVLILIHIVIPLFTGTKKLISDDEMLSHFKTYQHEIESLLEEYRTNPEEWGSFRTTSPEMQAIKEKSSVARFSWMSVGSWHKNPYSVEAAKQFHEDVMSGKIDNVRDKTRHAVFVSLTLKGVRKFNIGKYGGMYVRKEYFHIPQVAKIEDGKLLMPVNPIHPTKQQVLLISENLNQIPDWLEPGQCLLKLIDKHWYLSLCQSN